MATPAFAAGPYVVDDADIVAARELQNENWFYAGEEGHMGVSNLAYQLLPNAEFMLQASHGNDDGDHADLFSPQVKYRWHDAKTLKASLVVGGDRGIGDLRDSNLFAYVPVTFAANDRVDIHFNLGWLYARDEHQHFTIWGVGSEYHVTETGTFAAEIFKHNPHEIGYQFGPHWEPNDRVDLDLLYGRDVFEDSGHTVTASLIFHLPTD